MLDTETKRRINTCRDILVGKVPDPKSQVEQITIALIYKFMDDMDMQAEELGGRRSFFTGEYERYGWAKLVSPGVGGQEMLNTYGEALSKMVENPDIPELFRSIFRNAYLPYRDPETLRSFLREINGFSYDHSEKLGDAFEYLLSVLGSQGDAGQFRTPRHIIDFMVEIIDPKKTEVILDPACGTAGFLISAYKHILKSNSTSVEPSTSAAAIVDASEATLESPQRYKGEMLSTDDRERLAKSLKGYDISPDMVRLSLVNLYLHGFVDPKVEEYDTLTSEAKWGQTADVILANPPFMSPKGGIKPHNRFGVVSKRSEVLFVDYIAEHLTPNGRAAIVVPEGIIFQSQGAYCELRKMLVEKFLVAVISLPAGVFNPYSGVKTSILILDRAANKVTDCIAFFRIENDGFGLGAQRRAVKGGQLRQVQAEYAQWIAGVRGGGQAVLDPAFGFTVEKTRLAAGGEFNLSVERYREEAPSHSIYRQIRLGDLMAIKVPIVDPSKFPKETFELWSIPSHETRAPDRSLGADIGSSKKCVQPDDVLLSRIVPHIRRTWVVTLSIRNERQIASGEWIVFRSSDIDPNYLARILVSNPFHERFMQTVSGIGGSLLRASPKAVAEIEIPLPPLEVQQEIVAEIEGYQKIIDGARAVLENYRPHIVVDPTWEIVELGAVCKPEYGFTASAEEVGDARLVRITDIGEDGKLRGEGAKFITVTEASSWALLSDNDVLVARTGATFGKTMLFNERYPAVFASYLIRLRFDPNQLSARFYWAFAQSDSYWAQANALMTGGGQPQFNGNALKQIKIPFPPLETQQAIVAEIQAEQALVNGNRELIARFEKKIEAAIARVWGEAEGAAAT
jgi:type I restriction enzyme M protein